MNDIVLNLGVNDIQKDGKSLGDIVEWNEYGTELIPPRPANRIGMDIAVNRHKKMIQAYVKNYLMAIKMKDKKQSLALINKRKKVLFTQIGRSAVKEVKSIISSGSTVGNAPATIKKKGFDHPLYETGLYLDNVNFEVKESEK